MGRKKELATKIVAAEQENQRFYLTNSSSLYKKKLVPTLPMMRYDSHRDTAAAVA